MPLSSRVIKARNVQLVAKDSPDPSGFPHLDGGRRNNPSSASASPDNDGLVNGYEKPVQTIKNAYAKGFAAGVSLQKEQSLTTLNALSRVLQEMAAFKKTLLSDAEAQMLNLVIAVAEKVIYDEVSSNPQIILGVLREAINSVVDREGMIIRLNPQDYVFMMDMKSDFLREFSGIKNVSFEEDGGIERGGAMVETIGGEVDARLEQRVKEVKGALNIG